MPRSRPMRATKWTTSLTLRKSRLASGSSSSSTSMRTMPGRSIGVAAPRPKAADRSSAKSGHPRHRAPHPRAGGAPVRAAASPSGAHRSPGPPSPVHAAASRDPALLLRHVAHGGLPRLWASQAPCRPSVGTEEAQDHAKQRGLAGAVGADDPNKRRHADQSSRHGAPPDHPDGGATRSDGEAPAGPAGRSMHRATGPFGGDASGG